MKSIRPSAIKASFSRRSSSEIYQLAGSRLDWRFFQLRKQVKHVGRSFLARRFISQGINFENLSSTRVRHFRVSFSREQSSNVFSKELAWRTCTLDKLYNSWHVVADRVSFHRFIVYSWPVQNQLNSTAVDEFSNWIFSRNSSENKRLDLFSLASYRRRLFHKTLYRKNCSHRVGYVMQKIKEDSTLLDARLKK